jgi:hypothetical protein
LDAQGPGRAITGASTRLGQARGQAAGDRLPPADGNQRAAEAAYAQSSIREVAAGVLAAG